MKLAIDMLRILYLININQPATDEMILNDYVGGSRTQTTLRLALKLLQKEGYVSTDYPFTCTPKGLAALQSVRLYKARDAGRLFHLKSLANSDTLFPDER